MMDKLGHALIEHGRLALRTRGKDKRRSLLGRPSVEAVGQWLCLGGAALGAIGLFGWLSGLPSLTTIVPGEPPMMPNTALCLCLIGSAGALRRGRVRGVPRALSLLAAIVVLVISAATLGEYALGVDWNIDTLLLRVETEPFPGRISPPTAAALALLAAAMLLFDTRAASRARPSEWLIFSAGLVALTAAFGQVFGAGPLYRLEQASVIGVAVPTALSLLLTSAGLLLERADVGVMRLAMSPGPGGVMLRRLALAAVLGPALLGLLASRLLARLGVEDFALVYATLAVASAVVGLTLLTLTAVPLDRTHEALESSRARTNALIEQAADGILIADLDGRYTDVNNAACDMLGYARDELLGKSKVDLIADGEVERLARYKERLIAGGSQVGEWTFRRKDGAHVATEVSARILPDGRWQSFIRDISERKRAEKQIRQAMERFDLALRGADLAAWDWNINTGDVAFNARWAEMRGLRPEEVRPHVDSWTTCVHPDDLPGVLKALSDHLERRTAEYESEHRVLTKGGEWIWVLDRGRVFEWDEHGRASRMVGTELDITARKRIEEALRLSEAKFSGIISISSDAIVSVDEEQRIKVFNAGAEGVFGFTKEEALGAPLDILIPERFRADHRHHFESFAKGSAVARRVRERAIVGLRKNGEEFPAEASISKLEVGDTRLFTVTLRDITERRRKEAERAFLAEVGSLASTLEHEETTWRLANLIVQKLADFCIVETIEGGELAPRLRVSHRDPGKAALADALQRQALERRRPQFGSSVFSTGRPLLMSEIDPEHLETIAQSDEGARALCELGPKSLMSFPLLANGRLVGTLLCVSTTAGRRYGPEDLALGEEVARRTALAVDNASLYRAAQRAVQARDDVLGVVAHDLRNPLGVILLQAPLLRSLLGAKQMSTKPADVIERAASRMNHLIKDLLDVTRMEAAGLTLERVCLSTRQLVSESIESQRSLASAASLELGLDVADDLPDVRGDHDRLLQVFENLVGNASKFTKPGGRITIGAAPHDGGVMFWVADTGIGVAAEHLPHLFDRFWQSQKGGHRGAGLGLHIVKGVVEAHGGHIWVESTPGRGSTFFFTIPTACPVEPPSPGG